MDDASLYVALGDSLTEGIGAESPNNNFVSQVFQYLQHSNRCYMKNMGISGMKSGELLELIHNPGVQRILTRMTHCSITTGGCDFIHVYETGSLTIPRLLHAARQVHNHTRSILDFIRQQNPHSQLYVLGFYLPLPAYNMGIQQSSFLVKTLNRIYQALCDKYQAIMINPFDSFFQRFEYFYDDVHPNQKGYNELAKLFRDHLIVQSAL